MWSILLSNYGSISNVHLICQWSMSVTWPRLLQTLCARQWFCLFILHSSELLWLIHSINDVHNNQRVSESLDHKFRDGWLFAIIHGKCDQISGYDQFHRTTHEPIRGYSHIITYWIHNNCYPCLLNINRFFSYWSYNFWFPQKTVPRSPLDVMAIGSFVSSITLDPRNQNILSIDPQRWRLIISE